MVKMIKDNGNSNGKKIKFLFVSNEALAIDLAWQIKKEGHDVKMNILSKDDNDVGDGFIEKSDDWKKDADWADIVIFDDCLGFWTEADKLRKKGKLVVGGTANTDRLEDDREFGQEMMEKAGMNILPHWDFDNFDEAIKFVEKNSGRYVLKPSGKAANEKELLFVGQEDDGKDVLQVLQHYKKNWASKIKKFQLQKHAAGVEVACGAFFNGKDFITPGCVNFEHKRLFPGDIGALTGEMGTSAYFCQPNTFYKTTLEKMKPFLAQEGYVGYFDINCIVNARGIYPLEMTCRFGVPTISLQMEGITSKMSDLLIAMAKGESFDLQVKKGYQICVVIAVPPFPFNDPDTFRKFSEGATILFKKPNFEGIHLGDTKMVEEDWVVAGSVGYVLVITGSGPTMSEARKQAYNRVRNIMIPNLFYRDDIGERWLKDSDLLQTWGYLY